MKARKHRLCLRFRVGESDTKAYLLVQLDHLQEVVDDELLMRPFLWVGEGKGPTILFFLSLFLVYESTTPYVITFHNDYFHHYEYFRYSYRSYFEY